ncbi:MAG: exosome complex RNA-binding protein Csl4 [Candidatus Asgardarchaeia archaeon]
MNRKDGMFVVPGEKLGVIEEYIPGYGTYEREGIIYASHPGFVLIDKLEKKIKVFIPGKRVLKPSVGDVVIGIVSDVKDKVAFVDIISSKNKRFSTPFSGIIFVNKISREFIDSARSAFMSGDFIRAKVLKDTNPYQLTTIGRELGVITSHCSKCGALLKYRRRDMICSVCGNVERRKAAVDYNKVIGPLLNSSKGFLRGEVGRS